MESDMLGPFIIMELKDKRAILQSRTGNTKMTANIDHLTHFIEPEERVPTKLRRIEGPSPLTSHHSTTGHNTPDAASTPPFHSPASSATQSCTSTPPLTHCPISPATTSCHSEQKSSITHPDQSNVPDFWGKGVILWAKVGPYKLFTSDIQSLAPGRELESEVRVRMGQLLGPDLDCGAFLVPYGLLAVVVGIPLFLLESTVGQYTQEGFVTCWRKFCPLAQGIGYGHLVLKLYDFSYIIIQVWALFCLVFSFRSQLPWVTCDNTWNTVNCMGLQTLDSMSPNVTINQTMLTNTTSAATEFWERRVLAMSGGIEELGSVRWELVLCLLASWVFTYFSIWKSVRSSAKVAYFTATFPYVMLLILLIRGLTLPGAWEGIYYYMYPDLNGLANLEISFILYLVDYTHLRINDRYVYPNWAYALGWTMTLSSVLMVPLWAAGQMCWTAGTFRQKPADTWKK
eukprot:superscaffoldBa00003237_g16450